MSRRWRGGSPDPGRRAALLVALIFLVAMNLRTPLTSVGPLLPQISATHSLSEPAAGLLGALPLVAFAVVSPLVHHGASRLGADRMVGLALAVLVGGIVLRSYGGTGGLWAGTAALGAAIAVGNVLVPVLIRRDYPGRISVATAIFSACMGTMAALAAAVAVPVARATDWQTSLAMWAVLALVVAVLWVPRARGRTAVPRPPGRAPAAFPRTTPAAIPAPSGPEMTSPGTSAGPVRVWRWPTAWILTIFMGVQSACFYILVTWLPTISTAAGFSAEGGGLFVFGLQLTGIVAGLFITRLMRPHSQVGGAAMAGALVLAGASGLLLAPGLTALWAVVAGAGTGSSLVVALSLISLRGRTQAETTQLSGMVQSLGYLLAAIGPIVAGLLAQRTGAWHAPLLLLVALAVAQLVTGSIAGRVPRS